MTPSYKIASDLSERIYEYIATQKTVPWRQTWISRTYNPVTDTKYKGVNYFLTIMHMERHKLQVPQFLTFRQIQNLWGMVKKWASSVPIIFYKSFMKTGKDMDIDQRNELVSDNALQVLGHKQTTKDLVPSYFLRNYNVFWLEQTTLPIESYAPTLTEAKPSVDHEHLLKIIQDYCVREHIEVTYAGLRAYYQPGKDCIQIPRRENFERIEDFYFTLCHELAHSTGHRDRLGRFKSSEEMESSRREQYAFEEVVADMTASLLMQQAGLSPDLPNSASYINGFLRYWSDKKNQLYKACRQAQKACDYICNTAKWWNTITEKV